MIQILSTPEHGIIKCWLHETYIESNAKIQAINISELPFTFKHVCLMPDVHSGYGMPIGGVLATNDVVIPNACGVDIGCGVQSVKLNITIDDITKKDLIEIINKIKEIIPVGMNRHKIPQDIELIPEVECWDKKCPVLTHEYANLAYQIGTLGRGNHFIEIQKGSDDNHIYIMIHSGSRNIGYKVAEYYNNIAKELNKQFCSSVLKSKDLAFLPMSCQESQEYLFQMNYCIEFAKVSRNLMMDNCIKTFQTLEKFKNVKILETIDVKHNYISLENHFGHDVYVHRKGATSAKLNELCLIPGSQGTASYICVGKGNIDSYNSCSHGAGRLMSRTQAIKTLDLEKEQEKLDKLDIIHDMKSKGKLDEAIGAYKDIDFVMSNQTDLVDIKTKLTPLAVIKG